MSPAGDIHLCKAPRTAPQGEDTMTMLSHSRTLLLAALAGGAALWAMPAPAQQSSNAPAVNASPAPVPGLPTMAPGAPPPGYMQGAPDTPEVANIRPVPPLPI